jgi:lysophospholipase L1-like esterase
MSYDQSQFESELREFDNARAPQDATVFYGSSSIRLWDNIAQSFPGTTIVNRGFGGSTLAECLHLLPRVIYPLRPAALVLYAADNDLDQGASPEHAEYLFNQFMARIREHSPALPIAYVSVKPSPSRFWNIWKIRRANELIQAAIANYSGVTYLDVFAPMLRQDGGPRPELFTDDGLHMNSAGYDLWTSQIRSWLDSIPLRSANAVEAAGG